MSIGIQSIGGGTTCRPLVALTLSLVLAACGLVSRDEVAKAPSPDGRLEAVLIETNGGATTSFGYEIWLRQTDGRSGEEVAYLYGAIRSESAYGANLRWTNDGQLSIEYLKAQMERLDKQTVTIGGREVHVALKPQIADPNAPSGGMLFNLEREKQRLQR